MAPANTGDAVDRLGDVSADIGRPFRYTGRPVTFTFTTANVDTEIMHQTREVPHGWLVVDAPGLIKRAPGVQWTKDHAFLRCDQTGESTLLFYVLKEEPINVNP